MKKIIYKEYIPVEILYLNTEKPLWGRIIEIKPERCVIISKFDFRKYEKIYISFDIEKQKIENIPIKILNTQKDSDGYFIYTCSFKKLYIFKNTLQN